MTKLHIKDESGDKKYFTQIPNYIANHSTANDQALYFQMKRYAGEEGQCFATEQTLMKKLGVGQKAYNKSLKYLLDKKWIRFVGMTSGKTRPIKTYSIVDIWKLNVLEYEIPSKSTVSFEDEILAESKRDTFQKHSKIPSKSTVEEEPVLRRTKEEETLAGKPANEISQIIKEMEIIDPKNKLFYGNTTQRKASEFLIKEYGLEKVIQMIQIIPKLKNIPYMPSVTTPCELRDKWQKIIDAVARERVKQKSKVEVLFT